MSKTSLVATFTDAVGASETISWANIDPAVNRTSVRQFVNAVVSNSAALLKTTLTACTGVIIRTTTDTEVDISE